MTRSACIQTKLPTLQLSSCCSKGDLRQDGSPLFSSGQAAAKACQMEDANIITHAAEERALKRFQFFSKWCHPRVIAVYMRTFWNGWVTDRRLQSLLLQLGREQRECVLNCGCGDYSVYAVCSVFWDFACAERPRGLGLRLSMKSVSSFLLISESMSDEDSVRLGLGSCAL